MTWVEYIESELLIWSRIDTTIASYDPRRSSHTIDLTVGKVTALQTMIKFAELYNDDNECFDRLCQKCQQSLHYIAIPLAEYLACILKMPREKINDH